ncbi:zinc finger FYVE-type containing 26 spastizin [Colletes latitarsis]|uniref:zinc finger FYVE-type containing 26 spastizin n=1 Tax=Colletes latitarsis TaxID=2605962 RepID=UPI0040367B96
MTNQEVTLKINECILSKLWYTSLVVYEGNANDKSLSSQSDVVDFVESQTLFRNLIHLQSKSHHKWITQILLQKLVNNVDFTDVENIKKQHSYVEMMYALQLCKNMTMHVQQGLLSIYQSSSEQTNSEIFEKMHEECFAFLRQNIYNNSTVVCWIINELLFAYINKSITIVSSLQDLYLFLVKEMLESKLINDNSVGCVLCVISKMNILESNTIELSRWYFPMLLKTCNIQDIDLVLYSKPEIKLFNEWCIFLNEIYGHSKIVNNLNDVLKIQEGLFNCGSNSTPFINKNNLMKRITNTKQHWVIDILDMCYVLMMNKKYDNISSILSYKLTKTFWAALLFKILNDSVQNFVFPDKIQENGYFICDSIKFLMSKCDFNMSYERTLQELDITLKKYVKIVEYILNWTKENFTRDNDTEIDETIKSIDTFEQEISIKQIFNFLLDFNSFSVLKMTTDIHEQEYDKIENLLEDLCESKNIFYAYYSMLNALKAILLYDTYTVNQNIITSHFSDMKYYLQILYPLSLRVQVVKDIFSLLFLRYEDFDHTKKNYDKNNTSTLNKQLRFEKKRVEQSLKGFICNKYAIKDMLFHLKEIISVTEIEFMKMKNKDVSTEEEEQIQRGISSIDAIITDAKWRLEIYTNPQFTEEDNISKVANKNVTKPNVLLDGKSILNRFKENILFYQEGNTLDETKVRSDSSSESELIHNNTKWQKYPKNITFTANTTSTKDTVYKPLFVNFMLATKESLVIQCLWKNDYTTAQDIIEKSRIKDSQLNGEMQFSKALHAFRENIYKQTNTLKDKNQSKENAQFSTLENIRLIAQKGVHSSKQTSQLETFLASQEINLRMLNTDIVSGNEMLTICVLDLALTMSQIYSSSNQFFEVAMKYLKLCKTFDNTEYAHFFSKIYQLLYETKEKFSVENILCDAKISLAIHEYKEKDDFWTDIAIKYHEFKETQANKNTINKILKHSNYLPGLKIIGKMAVISNGTEKYMQNIFSHLQLLHTIIPTDQSILTVSDLLKISLPYYFGYQLFELKIEPNKLETVAHNLQFNLVYSILTNACPRLVYEKSTKYTIDNKENGCIILNKASYKSDLNYKTEGPNRCVSEILTELLEILQNLNLDQFYLSHDICKTISKHSDIQDVLSKTTRLINLDLSELSMGDETLTFLLNMWNLMFLHTTLTIWAHHPPFNNLQHAISLMSIGYLIGDLGLVTLAALRSKLLNNIMLNDKFFLQLEELNEPVWQDLDITHDPRVIFMMANELYGTPCIRVCNAKSLNEDLSNAFHEYLDYYSSKLEKPSENTENQKVIFLPDITKQYQNFVSQKYNCNSNDIDNGDNIFSVDDYFKLSKRDIVIQYIAPFYLYDVILKYTNCSNVCRQKQINRQNDVWETRIVRSSLLQYLEGHCWVVSYLLQRIYNENPTILENNCDNLKRTACLENLLSSSWIIEMKSLFENNQTLAAILETIPIQKMWFHFENALEENEWYNCLKLINALPDNLIKSTELECFKDKVLSYIVSKKDIELDEEILQYVYQIKDVYVLCQTVLYNINKWHINVCEGALLYAVHHADRYKLPTHCRSQLNEILHRVFVFHKMFPYCVMKSNGNWYDVAYCTEKVDAFEIMKILINADKFELCLEWLECQAFSLEIHPSVMQDFLIGLLKNESPNFKQTLKFLHALPLNQSVKLCKTVLKKLESIDSLQFICNYLLEYCKATETIKYRRTIIGIDILHMLKSQERSLYIHLIKEPLLMLEQLLMNCKFESIQKILNKIQDKLQQVDISRSSFDEIIKFYAQKSLDCRVSLQCDNIESKSKNVQHSVSKTENIKFVMPILVPTKEEWIPNDKATECSCCKIVIFSMFNRRHHCRRCGRVICAQCSQHRMHVSGYPPSVLVRVCNDCKQQTVLQMQAHHGAQSTSSSEMFDYWQLTKDQKHNQTIREEFSFEYAPNISLCLAILNLYSDHKTYTSFLLDRCDEIKHLLQPVSGGKVNPEVDHTVIIKMIRSLLIAAKVKCAKLGLSTGLAHCDRFLSQVDLIASFIQSDCLYLLPSDDLKERTFRQFRDLLIEKEQWILALDVSTKAGLDTQGVWVTWGKACLKMGYFDQARDKFCHCLDKIQFEDIDDWVLLSYSKDSTTSDKRENRKLTSENKIDEDNEFTMDELCIRRGEFSKSRPLKDPPLLSEILQMLNNLSTYKQHVQHFHQYKSMALQDVLSNFGNLKMTNQRQFIVKNASSVMQDVYYYESLYYLLTYGSYNSILEFFLKHEQFNECLTFTLENDLEPDLFFNAIYLYCLKNGTTGKLHEAMKNRDQNLLIWKKYLICVCHSLERRQYLNILYQLQLFMKDSIRAAMTCIRFYCNEVSNYTDFCIRKNFLLDAQKHLESELQVETLNRRRKKSTSSMHSNQGILTMEMEPSEIDKHINTICRQMEIAKYLATCEKEGRSPIQFFNLFPGKDCDNGHAIELPTLFGNQQQKIDLTVLAILCGRNVEEGFGIAFRIMQDYNLPQQKVYSLTGHILTLGNNVSAIEQLIKCCHTSGIPNSYIISDYVLTHCVKLLLNNLHSKPESSLKNDVQNLVRLITDIELKINAYIECKHLKAAYLLAVKHSRAQDIRKILKESDRLGQNAIKAICIKWLQQEPKS